MDYFGSKSPSDLRLDSMTKECVKTLLTLKIFWLMHMLGNFGTKLNLYFIFFAASLSKNYSGPLWGLIYLSTLQINSAFKKIKILLST